MDSNGSKVRNIDFSRCFQMFQDVKGCDGRPDELCGCHGMPMPCPGLGAKHFVCGGIGKARDGGHRLCLQDLSDEF